MWEKKTRRRGRGSKENRKGQGQRNVKKTGAQKILEVEKSIWKERVGKDASTENLGSHHRIKEGVYTKERKGILIIERRKKGGTDICGRPVEERIYPTLQITSNITSTLCGKKGWCTEDSTRLLVYKPVDDKKWIPFTSHHRYIRWSRKEEGVYKVRLKIGI